MISNLNARIQLNLRASLIKGKLKNVTVLSKATVNSDDLSGTGKNLPKVRPVEDPCIHIEVQREV